MSDPLIFHYPTLPQNDHENIVVRQNMIERRRMLFNFTKNIRLGGFAGTMPMPPTFLPLPPTYQVPIDERMYEYELNLLGRKMWGDLNQKLRGKFSRSIHTLQDYADATGFLEPKPKIISHNEKDLWGWLTDTEFVRQRLQGLNPEKIERLDSGSWNARFSETGKTPFNLQSVQKEVDDYIKEKGGVDFMTGLKEGNIYTCDYSFVNIQELMITARTFNRWLAAPIALFWRNAETKLLYPIAIQLFPGIKADNPVFLPTDDHMDWLMAKIWVQSVDGQYQEVIPHLFECHFVSEAFQVSMNRQLGTNHPVYQLIHPHAFGTMFINQVAKADLLSLSGPINSVISHGVMGVGTLINALYAQGWDFTQHSFMNSLKNRGFAGQTESSISGYFWEEDGVKLWNIMAEFVLRVLRIFYRSQEDLDNDFEVQGWMTEVSSPHGGALIGVFEEGKKLTIEHFADILTNLMWICTAKHSAGNIAQFELYGFIPNVPAALYSPPPTSKGKIDKGDIIAALPPTALALEQIAIVYLLSDTGAHPPQLINGNYPGLVKNPEADLAVKEFHGKLRALSASINTRNTSLTFPFESLDPAKVANSIYV